MEHTLDKYKNLVKYLFSLNRIQLVSATESPESWEKRVLDVCAGLFRGFSGMVCLSFRGGFDILFRNQAQRRNWAEIYNIIWEIPGEINFQSFQK